MTEGPSHTDRAHPFPELLPQRGPTTLTPAGWIQVDEAIAWIGFASAVPIRSWDMELALGLSLWPWSPSYVLLDVLKRIKGEGKSNRAPQMTLTLTVLSLSRGKADPASSVDFPSLARSESLNEALRADGERGRRWMEAALRAEAARCYDAWKGFRSGVEAAFLQATLAAEALQAALARAELTAYGMPAASENGATDTLVVREAIPASTFAGPVTFAPNGLHLYLPKDRMPRRHGGPAFLNIVLPARAVARLFPRAPGERPDLLSEALGRPVNASEAGEIVAEQGRRPETVVRTGTAGRPTSMHLVHLEHRRRIAASEAHNTLAAEAKHLLEWLKRTYPHAPPPKLKSLENAIRDEQPAHLKSGPKMNPRG